MKLTKDQKQARKLVHGHYTKIFQSCKDLAKAYSVKRLPVKLVDNILDQSYLTNVEGAEQFIKQMNLTLDNLRTAIHNQSAEIGDNAISTNEIGIFIGELKKAFDEGLMGETDEA